MVRVQSDQGPCWAQKCHKAPFLMIWINCMNQWEILFLSDLRPGCSGNSCSFPLVGSYYISWRKRLKLMPNISLNSGESSLQVSCCKVSIEIRRKMMFPLIISINEGKSCVHCRYELLKKDSSWECPQCFCPFFILQ